MTAASKHQNASRQLTLHAKVDDRPPTGSTQAKEQSCLMRLVEQEVLQRGVNVAFAFIRSNTAVVQSRGCRTSGGCSTRRLCHAVDVQLRMSEVLAC